MKTARSSETENELAELASVSRVPNKLTGRKRARSISSGRAWIVDGPNGIVAVSAKTFVEALGV